MGNTFGTLFRLTSFGESHGPAMGGIIDGMPARINIDINEIQAVVNRRRPGKSPLGSMRKEEDMVEILSGIFEGKTLGTSIGFIVRNHDQHIQDYDKLRDVYRQSHADYTYQAKYGIRDYRGGGRASARETVSRVVTGAFAMQALCQLGISVMAYSSQIGNVKFDSLEEELDMARVWNNDARCPNAHVAQRMEDAINEAREQGDTLGGVVRCVIKGAPAGLGEPVFGKLSASLGAAMLSIPAAKSFDIGAGRELASMRGSQSLDTVRMSNGQMNYDHNFSGGIQGGISNGNDICFEVGFKPIATLMRDIPCIKQDGAPATLHPGGRHDVCAVPRAVSVVQAMAAMVVLDHYLLNQTTSLLSR